MDRLTDEVIGIFGEGASIAMILFLMILGRIEAETALMQSDFRQKRETI